MSVPSSPTAFTDSPVVSPNAGTLSRRASYISPSQYRAVPTAVATNALIPGDSSAADNTNALAEIIAQASSWIDDHCFHLPDGSLAAGPVVEYDWIKVKDNGMLYIQCNFKPVIEVLGIALGPAPDQLTSLTSSKGIAIRGKIIEIPPSWYGTTSGGTFNFPVPTWRGGVYALWQYVSGFPHLALTGGVLNAGSQTLAVTNTVAGAGIYALWPGSTLTIHDGAKTETVVVASTYTPGSTSVPLVSGTVFAHTPPAANTSDWIPVTGLPESIIRACVHIVSAKIKTRGTRAQVMPSGPGTKANDKALAQAGAMDDVSNACKELKSYTTVHIHQ